MTAYKEDWLEWFRDYYGEAGLWSTGERTWAEEGGYVTRKRKPEPSNFSNIMEPGQRPPPLPLCAVCGKPVDRVDMRFDELRELVIYEARCHGAVERVTLTREELESVRWKLAAGVAFTTKKLPEATQEPEP